MAVHPAQATAANFAQAIKDLWKLDMTPDIGTPDKLMEWFTRASSVDYGKIGTARQTGVRMQALANLVSEFETSAGQARFFPDGKPWSVEQIKNLLRYGSAAKIGRAAAKDLPPNAVEGLAEAGVEWRRLNILPTSGRAQKALVASLPKIAAEATETAASAADDVIDMTGRPGFERIGRGTTEARAKTAQRLRTLRAAAQAAGTGGEAATVEAPGIASRLGTFAAGGKSARRLLGKSAQDWAKIASRSPKAAQLVKSAKLAGGASLATSPAMLLAAMIIPSLWKSVLNPPEEKAARAQLSQPLSPYLRQKVQSIRERRFMEQLAANPSAQEQYLKTIMEQQAQQQQAAANAAPVPGRVTFGG